MTIGYAVDIMRSGVLHVLIISAPVLLIGMLVGLVVSIFQATTSIQEQTLTFVPKIAAILLSIFFFGNWMLTTLQSYTLELFSRIPDMVR
ncbi:MAG: flagellar biosynthesis protein FliQ [Spirochaetales bacterium]|nr:flagellar biosynthesis protein FliQ [Spirochaetales bacterium]